jgi:hypothetical protein
VLNQAETKLACDFMLDSFGILFIILVESCPMNVIIE